MVESSTRTHCHGFSMAMHHHQASTCQALHRPVKEHHQADLMLPVYNIRTTTSANDRPRFDAVMAPRARDTSSPPYLTKRELEPALLASSLCLKSTEQAVDDVADYLFCFVSCACIRWQRVPFRSSVTCSAGEYDFQRRAVSTHSLRYLEAAVTYVSQNSATLTMAKDCC